MSKTVSPTSSVRAILASALLCLASYPILASAQQQEAASRASADDASSQATVPEVEDVEAAFAEARALLATGADSAQWAEGVEKLRIAADGGVVSAMLQLGDALVEGRFGLEAEPEAAVPYYQLAADAGEVNGLLRLGNLYRDGAAGLEPDGSAASRFYEEAIAADNNAARRYLGTLLLEGRLIDADPDRGVALYQEAIAQGDASAAIGLANIYRDGTGIAPDPSRAVALLEPLAEAGNTSALNALGDIYRAGGQGLTADPEKARDYFALAADLDNSTAARKLADMMIRGEGGSADFAGGVALLSERAEAGDDAVLLPLGDYYADTALAESDAGMAAEFYERAAAAGNVTALLRLGALYRDGGPGLAADGARARAYFEEAIDQGNNAGRRALAEMLLSGTAIEADPAAGEALYRAAIAEGDNASVLQLAEAYRTGLGVAADGAMAAAVLEPLAASDNVSALNALGDLYRTGAPGLPADPDAAKANFAQAQQLGNSTAARKIADMIIRGEGAEPDFEGGLSILRSLGGEGNPSIALAIGDYYADASLGNVDADQAVANYRQAASDGSVAGLLRLADLYRTGTEGLPPNGELAVAALQEASDAGNNVARRTLAGMLVAGDLGQKDVDRGLALLDAAMGEGDRQAALLLGEFRSNGRYMPADYDEAMRAFDAAIAAGHPSAEVSKALALTSGPLAREYKAEGVELLKAAVAREVPTARLALAQAQLAGRVDGDGLADAMATLGPAIEADDSAAIRFLIGFYRDGQRNVARPDLAAARQLVEQKAGVLGAPRVALENMLILAKEPGSSGRLGAFDAYFQVLEPQTRSSAVILIHAANLNAYVYLLQRGLAEKGLYDGVPNGQLGRTTINAVAAFCSSAGIRSVCDRGPLTPQAARAIANALFVNQ
ncbi:tetratricopeptide repeat protein [Devosia chinhatensis]|uniref:Peptidoglycan binding-like domain-containing protein n=1 Tax=Devosia chinhatensis TaxID=429727 RepID=A0A0F5FLV7_9HYPH|nr:SEL1-like repeat protein [Devosia chinhatensis]KKB09798.1 hypothetical protein VE26_08060 [Devosia chinhatensis]